MQETLLTLEQVLGRLAEKLAQPAQHIWLDEQIVAFLKILNNKNG